MYNSELLSRFAELSTANVADGCVRAGIPVRCAPAGTHSAMPDGRLAGRVAPARHAGSVDVFLEAITSAESGDVLVADNAGRLDESCIGDLMVLEAQAGGMGGILIWGLHRDTADVLAIGLRCSVWARSRRGRSPRATARLTPSPPRLSESGR